jgi:hypothetical protein
MKRVGSLRILKIPSQPHQWRALKDKRIESANIIDSRPAVCWSRVAAAEMPIRTVTAAIAQWTLKTRCDG